MAATADMIAEFGCSLQKNTMPSILPISELNLAIRAVAYPAKSRNVGGMHGLPPTTCLRRLVLRECENRSHVVVRARSIIPATIEFRGNMSNLLIENPSAVGASKAEVSPAAEVESAPPRASVSPRNWLVITCLLLSISGGIRYWRERKFQNLTTETKSCPFPLKEIPNVLGTWRDTGAAAHLDAETLRLADASDHILRTYTDSKTGETVSVLVVYGLAYSTFGHLPTVCYPASGYTVMGKPADRELLLPEATTPAHYRSAFFSRSVASVTESHEVFWSFSHAGLWLPDVSGRWKLFRTSPALFKIQIQSPATGLSSDHPPVETLLKDLMHEIDTRREQAAASALKTASTGVKTPR